MYLVPIDEAASSLIQVRDSKKETYVPLAAKLGADGAGSVFRHGAGQVPNVREIDSLRAGLE